MLEKIINIVDFFTRIWHLNNLYSTTHKSQILHVMLEKIINIVNFLLEFGIWIPYIRQLVSQNFASTLQKRLW